jgi:TorA maturation chaperone TorD
LKIDMRTIQDAASGGGPRRIVDEIDRARSQEYALLSTLLMGSPDVAMIGRLARLRGDATPLGIAHAALAEAAARTNAESARREYFTLFAGLGDGGLLPYASHYREGTLYGGPLAQLRDTLRSLSIEKVDGYSEPEDHAGILCGIMASLADGRIAIPAEAERAFFEEHLAPWMARFFADLERAPQADLYARVGTVGRVFIEIETKAFALPA